MFVVNLKSLILCPVLTGLERKINLLALSTLIYYSLHTVSPCCDLPRWSKTSLFLLLFKLFIDTRIGLSLSLLSNLAVVKSITIWMSFDIVRTCKPTSHSILSFSPIPYSPIPSILLLSSAPSFSLSSLTNWPFEHHTETGTFPVLLQFYLSPFIF